MTRLFTLVVISLVSVSVFAEEPNIVQSWEKKRAIKVEGPPSYWHPKKETAISAARQNAYYKLYDEAEKYCPKGRYDWDTKSISYVDYEFGRDINSKSQRNQYKFKAQAYAYCNPSKKSKEVSKKDKEPSKKNKKDPFWSGKDQKKTPAKSDSFWDGTTGTSSKSAGFWDGDESTLKVGDKTASGNQNLGEKNVYTNKLLIKYHDHGTEDGDRINIFLNNKLIRSNVMIYKQESSFEVNLGYGNNRLAFESTSDGDVGPNTAMFTIFDGNGKLLHEHQWQVSKGSKAILLIVKI